MRARRRWLGMWMLCPVAAALAMTTPRGARAEAPPMLSLHLDAAKRDAAPGALPLTLRLVNRGVDPVRVAPLSVNQLAVPARAVPATVHLAMAILGERHTVPRTALKVHSTAAPAPSILAPGQSLALDLDVTLDTARPGVRTIQAVYQSQGTGLLSGAVASDVLRVFVGPDAARGDALLLAPARGDPPATTQGPRLLVDLPRLGGAPDDLKVTFTGTGTTHAVEARVSNPGAQAVLLRVPTGVRFVAQEEHVQVLMAAGAPSVLCPPRTTGRVLLPAFCTDRDKAPPDVGVVLDVVDGTHPRAGPPIFLRADAPRDESDSTPRPVHLEQLAIAAHAYAAERAQFLPTGFYRGPDGLLTPPPLAIEPPTRFLDRGSEVKPGVIVLDALPLAPPGVFERARSTQPPPTAVFTREPWSGRPEVGRGAPIVLLGPDQSLRASAPTFADTAILWTVWAVTNDGGTPNAAALSTRTETQAKAQGVTEARAKAAGAQVAAEVIPVVTEALARAREAVDLEVDFGALDLSLKGAPAAPEPSTSAPAAPAPSSATLERHRALAVEITPPPAERSVDPNFVRSESSHLAYRHGTRVGVEGPATAPAQAGAEAEAAPVPAPTVAPSPAPFELQTDWWRRREGEDLEHAERLFLRISGNRVEVWGETLPHRYGGTFQWYDFGASGGDPDVGAPDFGEGRTLEQAVRDAIANEPPKPSVAELQDACRRGALSTANARIVSVLESKSQQRVVSKGGGGKGRLVEEQQRVATLSFEHAWIYDCKTGLLERRLSIRFTVTEMGRHVSEHVVDRLLERESIAPR